MIKNWVLEKKFLKKQPSCSGVTNKNMKFLLKPGFKMKWIWKVYQLFICRPFLTRPWPTDSVEQSGWELFSTSWLDKRSREPWTTTAQRTRVFGWSEAVVYSFSYCNIISSFQKIAQGRGFWEHPGSNFSSGFAVALCKAVISMLKNNKTNHTNKTFIKITLGITSVEKLSNLCSCYTFFLYLILVFTKPYC